MDLTLFRLYCVFDHVRCLSTFDLSLFNYLVGLNSRRGIYPCKIFAQVLRNIYGATREPLGWSLLRYIMVMRGD